MSFELSAEQQRILDEAKPPSKESSIVRITAAAGTGKTTTLLYLAKRLTDLGHSSITYITYNAAAAADARQRLLNEGANVDARTLHSCAMSQLTKSRQQEEDASTEGLLLDAAFRKEMDRRCKTAVDDFLGPCYDEIARRSTDRRVQASKRESAKRQVNFFIFKSLKQFCESDMSLETWSDPRTPEWQRYYYPARKFHWRSGGGTAMGFLPSKYEKRIGFYADCALKLWHEMSTVITYNLEMKRAQLAQLDIPGTALLVDECQDLDSCQIDWVKNQRGKQIYFVGDAAQTIYSFRGAKSKCIMNLNHPTTDCTLTKSWRFGPNIAQIANIILFAKQHSPQTTGKKPGNKSWQPYRLTGGGKIPGTVTSESLLPKWKTQPVTLIAFSNVRLLIAALSLLGHRERAPMEDNAGVDVNVEASANNGKEQKLEQTTVKFDPNNIPKFHINGKGPNSGRGKWRKVFKQVEDLYGLYMAGEGSSMRLPPDEFPQFVGQDLSWSSFRDQVERQEIDEYAASIALIESFHADTLTAVQVFQENVVDKNCPAADADVILSTCHAAKGMEWDNVQVLSDFCPMATLNEKELETSSSRTGWKVSKRAKVSRKLWQFSFKSYGDDVNLMYVACTRAKKMLSVPKVIKQFLQECDLLHELLATKKASSAEVKKDGETTATEDVGSTKQKNGGTTVACLFGSKRGLTDDTLENIYTDIVQPVRMQCQVGEKLLIDALFYEGGTEMEGTPHKTSTKQDTSVESEVVLLL